jgi:hypothetical protein
MTEEVQPTEKKEQKTPSKKKKPSQMDYKYSPIKKMDTMNVHDILVNSPNVPQDFFKKIIDSNKKFFLHRNIFS